MEKITTFEELQKGIDYQKGVETFRSHHKLPIRFPEARKLVEQEGLKLKDENGVKTSWYKRIVSGQEYKEKYKTQDVCVLDMRKEGTKVKEVELAYLAVTGSSEDMPIMNEQDMLKIKVYLSHRNLHV